MNADSFRRVLSAIGRAYLDAAACASGRPEGDRKLRRVGVYSIGLSAAVRHLIPSELAILTDANRAAREAS